MNKILVVVGFLVCTESLFGMDGFEKIESRQPEFEYNETSGTLVCRNMEADDFNGLENELDCALHVFFDNCRIPEQGVSCANAWALSFNECKGIDTRKAVFEHVSLFYTAPNEAAVYINGEFVSQ